MYKYVSDTCIVQILKQCSESIGVGGEQVDPNKTCDKNSDDYLFYKCTHQETTNKLLAGK